MLLSSTAKKATNCNSCHKASSPPPFPLSTRISPEKSSPQQQRSQAAVWHSWPGLGASHLETTELPQGSKCSQTTGECPAFQLLFGHGILSVPLAKAAWMSAAKWKQGNLLFTANHSLQFFSCSLRKQFNSLVKKKVIGKHQEVGKSEGLLSKRSFSWWATEEWGNLGGGWHHQASKTEAGACSACHAPHFLPGLVLSVGGFSKGLQTEVPNLSWSLQQLTPWS